MLFLSLVIYIAAGVLRAIVTEIKFVFPGRGVLGVVDIRLRPNQKSINRIITNQT